MNELTIISGGLLLLLGWAFFCIWLGEEYDFFALPLMSGVPLLVLFIASFFIH